MTPGDRREQERARRKQEILQAARAVFNEDGFGRATVDAVAQRAEVGKGTIYLYFANKDAILSELTFQALGDLVQQLRAANDRCSPLHPDHRLSAMAEAYLAFARNAPDYFRLLNAFSHGGLLEGITAEMRDRIVAESSQALDLVAQAISDGVALGMFTPGDARIAASVLWGALNGALALMTHPIRQTLVAAPTPDFYRATLELCFKGLVKRD